MAEKPIIICQQLIPPTLDGRKTMTRRVIKPQPSSGQITKTNHPNQISETIYDVLTDKEDDGRFSGYLEPGSPAGIKQYSRYQVGDHLWVRETFGVVSKIQPLIKQKLPMFEYANHNYQGMCSIQDGYELLYKATQKIDPDFPIRWRASRFMPKWAARIWLEVLSVRAERLQEITEKDAIAEGMVQEGYELKLGKYADSPIEQFAQLWNSLNAKRGYPWESNPWVWRYEFKLKQGSDELQAKI